MKSIFFLSLLTIFTSTNAFAEPGDGVIFDESGLTIIKGQKPLVDTSRWNFSDGVYVKSDGSIKVKVIKNAQDKIEAVKRSSGNLTEIFANNIYSGNVTTVTSKFCKQFEEKKIEDNAKKCQNFLTDLFTEYEDQATEANVKTFREIAALDGVTSNFSLEAMKQVLKQQRFSMQVVERSSIIANIGYLATRCAGLKRYSSDDEVTAPVKDEAAATVAK